MLVSAAAMVVLAGTVAAALAANAADSVPAGFNYNLTYVDDLAQRFRLANRMWFYVRDRGSIAVAPTWRIGPQLPPNTVQNALPSPASFAATARQAARMLFCRNRLFAKQMQWCASIKLYFYE